jgi:citrate synthase
VAGLIEAPSGLEGVIAFHTQIAEPDVPPELFTPMFSSARVGGWAAHNMEQKREGRLIRPTARYIGPGPRATDSVNGAAPA